MTKTDFIARELESDIAHLTPPRAVVIIGPRQCGKTTLLKHITKNLPGHTRWFRGDISEQCTALESLSTQNDFELLLKSSPNLVIDEAQNIQNIGRILKVLVDLNMERDAPIRIFVTGSSALEITTKTKESGVGRLRERRMWPFSLSEIASHYGSWGYVEDNLERFMTYGLLPEIITDPESSYENLAEHRDRLLFRDIKELGELRKTGLISALASKLARRIGSEVSYEGLAQDLGVSRITVQTYVKFLEMSCIVKVVPSFSRNLDNELKKGKKIYFTDLGIRNSLINDFSPFGQRDDRGAIWENFFFIERMKLHDTLRDRKDMYFWRTKGNLPRELDFLEVRDGELEAFECKLSPKEKAKPGEAFQKAYPHCPIHIVTPKTALPFLGMTD